MLARLRCAFTTVRHDLPATTYGNRKAVHNMSRTLNGLPSSAEMSSKRVDHTIVPRAEKVRILKLPRGALMSGFYAAMVPNHQRINTSLFRLVLRPLSANVIRNVNIGPTWLRGDYPAGVMERRHERRRPINDADNSKGFWRDVSEDGELPEYEPVTESVTLKRPLLLHGTELGKAGNDDELWWPVLGVVSIKGVDKRAVYRNRAKSRTLHAFHEAIQTFADRLPRYARNGDLYAYVFYPTSKVITSTRAELDRQINFALQVLLKNKSKIENGGRR